MTRKLILTGLILLFVQIINAQINGVTETGDEIVLYSDGTWKYVNEKEVEKTEIPINNKKFSKDKKSSFLVKSKKVNIGVWINPKGWSFSKGTDETAYEFQFLKKGGDLYGMLITEKMQIPVETLKDVAIQNAKNAAPDIKVLKEEYRTVNGIQVFMMQMSGTIQGMKITYYGYYYSNSNGTIQLITYTGDNLFNDYKDEIEVLLNGFVEI